MAFSGMRNWKLYVLKLGLIVKMGNVHVLGWGVSTIFGWM
jgi:hypothetical protein